MEYAERTRLRQSDRRVFLLSRQIQGAEVSRWEKVFLRIGSIDDTGVIFLNGREIGRQDGPRNWNKSFEMDVTDVLRQGEDNLLAVRGYDSGGGEGVWRPSALYTK